jgi:hypothetical protein
VGCCLQDQWIINIPGKTFWSACSTFTWHSQQGKWLDTLPCRSIQQLWDVAHTWVILSAFITGAVAVQTAAASAAAAQWVLEAVMAVAAAPKNALESLAVVAMALKARAAVDSMATAAAAAVLHAKASGVREIAAAAMQRA